MPVDSPSMGGAMQSPERIEAELNLRLNLIKNDMTAMKSKLDSMITNVEGIMKLVDSLVARLCRVEDKAVNNVVSNGAAETTGASKKRGRGGKSLGSRKKEIPRSAGSLTNTPQVIGVPSRQLRSSKRSRK